MFDRGDFANGYVRISGDLRRRRNGNRKWNYDARHRGDIGRRSAVGNINVVGNIHVGVNRGDVGRIDILRNAGDVGPDGNVRRWLEQHCRIVEPNVSVAHHIERRRSIGNSVGILPARQSRG
jgi:hypothetical protein